MRQLRPGAGESGLLTWFLTALWFLALSFGAPKPVAAAATADRGSSRVENSLADVASSGSNNVPVKAIGSQAPKELAVVSQRAGSGGYGGIRGSRGGNMVGGYVAHRSLDDYEMEDFVLMATVNGTLSARDRRTGKERWQIHTVDAAVETINHRTNSSSSPADPDDMMTWIVEPSEDGELFFYTPEGGLEVIFALCEGRGGEGGEEGGRDER